jgi:hypothetical protein
MEGLVWEFCAIRIVEVAMTGLFGGFLTEERRVSSQVEDLGDVGDEGLVDVGVDEALVVVDAGPVDRPYELCGVFDS